jgi:lipopolysaccharide export system protein LptC
MRLVVALALLAFGVPLRGADPSPVPIDIPIPVGEPVSGIKIPQYDETGKLSMTLLAGKARKLDDRKVEFENLKISFTDKEGKEILVEIPHALLDTQTKVLSAESKTVITREDFDIDGEKAEFDTVSRTGRFKGRVRASFRNSATFGQPSS